MIDNREHEGSATGHVVWHVVIGFLAPLLLSLCLITREREQEERQKDEARRERFREIARDVEQSVRDGTASRSAQMLAGIKNPKPPIEAQPWQPAELVGHTLRLAGDTAVRELSFVSETEVTVRLGDRKGPGAVHRCRWEIDKFRALVVTDPADPAVAFRLLKVRVEADRYQVANQQKPETYLRTKD